MNNKIILNSFKNYNTKGLEILEKDGIPPEILTDVFLMYKLSDLDSKPMFRGLNFTDRLRRVLIINGKEKIVEIKIKLKNIGAGLSTTKKILELQNLGLDAKKIAKRLDASHFILNSKLFSDKEKISYLKKILKRDGGGLLRLNSLNLTEIPKVISSLKENVTNLEFSKNPITELPIQVFEFSNLKVLHLENTKITSFPEDINKLEKLEEIWLEKSKLKKLPKTIGALKNLKILHCEDTKLVSIPNEIGECKSLRRLILFGTKIETVPKELKKLKYLNFLSLMGTPFSKDINKVNELKKILPKNCKLLI